MCKRYFPFMALIALVGIGCQNSTSATSQTMAPPQSAVVVNYPNGGGTTVFLRSANSSEPLMLCTSGNTECPECKAAAIKYFQTGVLDPHCSSTGATRTIAIPPAPYVSHN